VAEGGSLLELWDRRIQRGDLHPAGTHPRRSTATIVRQPHDGQPALHHALHLLGTAVAAKSHARCHGRSARPWLQRITWHRSPHIRREGRASYQRRYTVHRLPEPALGSRDVSRGAVNVSVKFHHRHPRLRQSQRRDRRRLPVNFDARPVGHARRARGRELRPSRQRSPVNSQLHGPGLPRARWCRDYAAERIRDLHCPRLTRNLKSGRERVRQR
jgi:hypothetical protein